MSHAPENMNPPLTEAKTPDVPALALAPCSLLGLRYALDLVRTRRSILNRPAAYIAACDEMEIFLEAAIDRVERGEPMGPTAVVQANTNDEPRP